MKLVNPSGPGKNKCRVFRGGGWGSSAVLVVSYRHSGTPGFRNFNLGFRLVCNGRKE